ncbi:HNH endonuclease signature motif containing protein [Actinomadura sp. HBU206391]|uniref:HNH endonuclease signature motif containing protein n=1 Tax=Actinomadura sp. HBU206391 TaxID=2731692 RepID=UPI00164F4C1C|nr:HNH endonuclease signature motif containing protein [Actinomadura sp. HBU206391]MBC6459255.1 DUF222 domain-containing protein [Actinomadura sp. HBU206391]
MRQTATETVTELGGASPAELVEALSACVSELAARRPPESAVACMELAERLGRVIDVGEAALAALVRRVDCAGEVRGSGYSCTSAWLRDRMGMRTGRARERLMLARQLPRLARTGERLRTGTLSYGYAATLTDALARLDDADATAGEQILLELADDGACADRVARAGVRIGEVVAERDGREPTPPDARRGFKRSWITRSASLDGGTWIKGWLSPEHTAVWNQTLAPLTTPTGAADDRDHAHRTADAVFSILSQGHQRTTATVIIDLDTLNGGTHPGSFPGGGLISAERARQIALTAGVSALILGSGGHPLYLGRTARFATLHQRRVLETLYDTCAVQGCEIPARYCEIHHTGGGWKTGTPTDITRLAPLCSFHNQWVEQHPHQVREHRDDHGRHVLRLLPPWATHPDDNPTGDTGAGAQPQGP